MDCDLQDAPEDIPLLYTHARQGFDIVVGVLREEGHGFVKRHTSRLFYLMSIFRPVSIWTGELATTVFFPIRSRSGSARCGSKCGFFPRA